MSDCTHKRFLIKDKKTGEKSTVIVKIGSSYISQNEKEIVSEIGRINLTKQKRTDK